MRWTVSFVVVAVLLAACGTPAEDGVKVRVEPSSVTLQPNEAASFTASVAGGQNTAVDWTATGGSIEGSGATITYTAPDAAGDYNIVATSQEDPTKSDTAVAEVLNGFDDVSPIGYDGETVAEGTSDAAGRLVVESVGSGARYEIALRTPSGQPAANVAVAYTENARGRSEFVFTDPEGRFMPYLLTGTPEEVVEHLDGTIAEVSGADGLRPNVLLTAIGISVTLTERLLAFRENQVAHQELRGFVETGDDLCPEADGYCRCASVNEISMFQRAAIESEGYWIDTGVTAVTWVVGQGIPSEKVGTVVEVAGIGADAATILNDFTAAGHASAIVEAAGTTPVYAGLSAEEELLVRLLAFDGGGRKPTWRAVQIINRGCESGLVSNPGTLDVTYDPFPPDTGQDLLINVDVADPVEEGLEVFLSMESTDGYPAFERWVSATTNDSGRAEFKVPPHVLSSIPNLEDNIEIVVPKRDLVMGEPSTISWDVGNTRDPSPTIWSLTPSANRVPVGDEVRFRYLVNQRTTISDEAFDLACSIDFGDGTVRDDAPCVGTNTYQYIPWTSVRHIYEQPGFYIAKLSVTNGNGKTDTVHAPITITAPTNEPPTLDAFAVSELEVGLNETVAITWTTSDPEGDQLSCALGFGDGSASELIDPCNGSFERFKDYDAYGGYPITLRVLDRSGGLAGEFAFVQVTDPSTSPTKYPLTVSLDGNGTVTSNPAGIDCPNTCIAEFDEGASVTLTPTPTSGWTFDTWVGDAECKDGRVDVTAPTACTATFVEASGGEAGSVAWQVGTGDVVVSSPAIASDGVVYVGSNDGHLYAIDGADGDVLWQYPVPGGVFSSPAVTAEGTVLFGGADDFVYAVDPAGDLRWRYETVTDAPAVGGNGVVSSPAIGADGTIYVGASDGYLYALSTEGQLEWRYPTGYRIQAGPSIGANGTIYFGSRNGTLYALDPDGTLQWSYTTGSEIRSSVAIDSDGSLYVGSFDGYLYKLNSSGEVEWRHDATASVYSSPAVGDGRVYVGSSAGDLTAIDSDTGGVLWRYDAGGPVPSSPALGDDGTVLVGSNNGFLNALSADGALLWRHEAAARVYSSPNIGSSGLVYVGSNDGHLYAVHTASNGLADTPWPSIHRNRANDGR